MHMNQTASVAAPPVPATPPQTDHRVMLRNVSWADYQRLLEIRGDRSVPRITYLQGLIELISPSQTHESIKSMIACLIEAWCIEKGVDITPYGSWTIENKEVDRGIEPDECYVLGDHAEARRPDLAIEVIWSSGGIKKLDVYRKLGVREVWIWKKRNVHVYALRDEGYEEVERSQLLPNLNIDQLLEFVDIKPMTKAVRAYKATMA
ncbi:MAG: Uma2 family endonuclease [Gammaproteobacteria bacterium]